VPPGRKAQRVILLTLSAWRKGFVSGSLFNERLAVAVLDIPREMYPGILSEFAGVVLGQRHRLRFGVDGDECGLG